MFFDPRKLGTPANSANFGDGPTGKISRLAKLSAPSDPQTVHRLWLVKHPDGRLMSHSFDPPVTSTEVKAWYPSAVSIETEGAA